MFFLFGWGHRTHNDHGPTFPATCTNCSNENWMHLFSYRTWFTLFFIPLIPYESRTLLICPVCSAGIMLAGDSIDRHKQLNLAARAFLAGEIEEEDYLAMAKETGIGDSRRIPTGAKAHVLEVQDSDGAGPQVPQLRYADATICLACKRRIGRFGGHEEVSFQHEQFMCRGNVHADCAMHFQRLISSSGTSQLYARNFETVDDQR